MYIMPNSPDLEFCSFFYSQRGSPLNTKMCVSYLNVIYARPWESRKPLGTSEVQKQACNSVCLHDIKFPSYHVHTTKMIRPRQLQPVSFSSVHSPWTTTRSISDSVVKSYLLLCMIYFDILFSHSDATSLSFFSYLGPSTTVFLRGGHGSRIYGSGEEEQG